MKIKLLVMDVDGTLTDGKIYMGENGEVMKAFDIKDGYGINEILPKLGIIPVIITGRTSKIVENRARELHITELYQGKHDKLDTMLEVMKKYHCTKENAAYIGVPIPEKLKEILSQLHHRTEKEAENAAKDKSEND